jgi:hypothetical protein
MPPHPFASCQTWKLRGPLLLIGIGISAGDGEGVHCVNECGVEQFQIKTLKTDRLMNYTNYIPLATKTYPAYNN